MNHPTNPLMFEFEAEFLLEQPTNPGWIIQRSLGHRWVTSQFDSFSLGRVAAPGEQFCDLVPESGNQTPTFADFTMTFPLLDSERPDEERIFEHVNASSKVMYRFSGGDVR
jgi:hypothetical protein